MFIVVLWVSLVNLRHVQTLGDTYMFLIILRICTVLEYVRIVIVVS